VSSIDGVISELLQFPLFRELKRDAVLQLCRGARVDIHRHHECAFQSGEPAGYFGIVLTGAYKLARVTSEGNDVIVYFSTPGDVLAALIMTKEQPVYPVSAVAMGPSRLLNIPKSTYTDLWMKDHGLVARIQNSLSNRMGHFQNQKAMVRAPLSSKIAVLLINLMDKQG
jgi:CRP-like cAMP-binding protein